MKFLINFDFSYLEDIIAITATTMSFLKSEMTCNICKLILKNPVSLPCSSSICGDHMVDGTAKNRVITCLECEKDFDVPSRGFEANLAMAD